MAILPVFFDALIANPEIELERVCRFIGYRGRVKWDERAARQNISAERARKFPLYNFVVEHPIAAKLRRGLVPKAIRTKIRETFTLGDRPILKDAARKYLEERLDQDMAVLGDWLGVSLNCQNFRALTGTRSLEWR
jgi:hypothetical protein